MTHEDGSVDDRDAMQHGFDQMRLAAGNLRHQVEEGRDLPPVKTGDAELDAKVHDTLATLMDAVTAHANATDQIADHYQPLYEADKRAGLAGPETSNTQDNDPGDSE